MFSGLDLDVIGSRAEEIFGGRWLVCCFTYLNASLTFIYWC